MPKVSDGVALFNRTGDIGRGNTLLDALPTNNATANAALGRYWANKLNTDQYEWDVAAWYGALTMPGHSSIAACLVKLFTVMRHAGVYYDKGTVPGVHDWKDCSVGDANMPNGIPLGSILAHGGRMLIQLPVRTEHQNEARGFFAWLTEEARAANRCVPRTTATHALAERSPALPLPIGRRKFRIEEKRGKKSGIRGAIKSKIMGEENHWGVNIPLFGFGRTNWFSGNTVDANGGHGHLYLYINTKDPGQCGGMMVGGENSGVGAMSQTFVGHGAKAVSEDFSPAGTYKWPDMDHGPNHMIEEFLVDLSHGWTWLRGKELQFDPAWLDHTPNPINTIAAINELRHLIYELIDLLDAPPAALGTIAKLRLDNHRKTLLFCNTVPRAVLVAIKKEILEAMGWKHVTILIDGSAQGDAPTPSPTPLPFMNMLGVCNQSWRNAT